MNQKQVIYRLPRALVNVHRVKKRIQHNFKMFHMLSVRPIIDNSFTTFDTMKLQQDKYKNMYIFLSPSILMGLAKINEVNE